MARKRKPKMDDLVTAPVEELFEVPTQSSVEITIAPPPIVKVEVVKETPTENYVRQEIENIINQIKNNLEVLKAIKHAAHASPVANRIDALLESIKAKL